MGNMRGIAENKTFWGASGMADNIFLPDWSSANKDVSLIIIN